MLEKSKFTKLFPCQTSPPYGNRDAVTVAATKANLLATNFVKLLIINGPGINIFAYKPGWDTNNNYNTSMRFVFDL